MVTVLRPLSISELLDRTFHLYRNNFVVFVGIMVIPQLAVLFLQLIASALLVRSGGVGAAVATIIAGIVMIGAGFASFIAIEIAHAATVIAVSDLHLDRPATISSSYSGARSSMLRVIGISLGVGIAVGVGFLLLIAPGVYLALAWCLAIPVTVLEGGGLNVSTTRSKALTQGGRGRIFVISLLVFGLTMMVSFLVQLPLGLVTALAGQSYLAGATALAHALQAVGSFVSTCLVGPLGTIALTLIYYDHRVRKEGFDLQLMMATLEPGPQVAQAAPAS
jgi:hypothetical protein